MPFIKTINERVDTVNSSSKFDVKSPKSSTQSNEQEITTLYKEEETVVYSGVWDKNIED